MDVDGAPNIVHTIHRSDDPEAKCLVYVQWDMLKLKLLVALREVGISARCLQGNPLEMSELFLRLRKRSLARR
jgi:hypothetical protein